MSEETLPPPGPREHMHYAWLLKHETGEFCIAKWQPAPHRSWTFAGDDVDHDPDRIAANGWCYHLPVLIPEPLNSRGVLT